jgi:hypothetical protein
MGVSLFYVCAGCDGFLLKFMVFLKKEKEGNGVVQK